MKQTIFFKSAKCNAKECPVCHAFNSNYFLELNSPDYLLGSDRLDMKLIECSECRSMYWEEPNVTGYIDGDTEGLGKYTDHYILVGAGIDLGTQILSNFKNKESLLEVGCGFGFNLDYWSNYCKKPSIGLEAADYGKVGKEYLDVSIDDKYLSAEDKPIGDFDIVFASEVIEHTTDPLSFLQALKNNLAPEGVLILTTPAAEFITEDANRSLMLAALSPGLHYFLLSRKSIHLLLKMAGFNSIDISVENERIIVVARIEHNVNTNLSFQRDEYIDYLYHLSKNSHEVVREGALFRLFKELVNKGNYDDAEAIFNQLNSILINKYEFDISMFISCTSTDSKYQALEDYLYRFPPYISILLFYLGILNSRYSSQMISKLICFSASYQLGVNIVNAAPQFAQEAESLVHVAGGELANALMDNLQYFDGYLKGKNSGWMGEFLTPDKVSYLSDKTKSHDSSNNFTSKLFAKLKKLSNK